MRTVEHVNECAFCGDDADYKVEIRELIAPEDGQTKIIGRAAVRTGYVQVGATIVAACDPCRTHLKHLLDSARPQSARDTWIANHKAQGVAFIADEKARIAAQEAELKAEADRIAAEEEAKRQAEVVRIATARAARAATIDAMPKTEQIKALGQAVLDGSATDEERARFAALVSA